MTALLDPVLPAHSVLYRYLAEGFGLPEPQRIEYLENSLGIVAMACQEMVESGDADGPLPDFDLLAQALAAARSGPLGDYQAEYTRLFVAGHPTTPCRPIESVQREGMLVGEATESVIMAYLRFNLEAKEKEPDNLTAELEFLAYLTGTPVAAGKEAERYRRVRDKFLQEHLLQWAPGLSRKIRANTENSLYRAMADLLDWVLAADMTLKV